MTENELMRQEQRHILLTNDDGVQSPGLQALIESLLDWADVTVVAPRDEQSASGHSITVHLPLRVNRLQDSRPGLSIYTVNGTPSDCVKFALDGLLEEPPDLLISGINNGANLGTDVIYSGTVSAAMEGALMGVSAIAISLAFPLERVHVASDQARSYKDAAVAARSLAVAVGERGLPEGLLLNVNVPAQPRDGGHCWRATRLGIRRYVNVFEKRVDPRGRVYYWMAGDPIDTGDEGTDVHAVQEGLISVTPLRLDLTASDYVSPLRRLLETLE